MSDETITINIGNHLITLSVDVLKIYCPTQLEIILINTYYVYDTNESLNKEYYDNVNRFHHSLNGPSVIEISDPKKYREWFVYGQYYGNSYFSESQKEYDKRVKEIYANRKM